MHLRETFYIGFLVRILDTMENFIGVSMAGHMELDVVSVMINNE
jgi:hypothetical protein